MEKLNLKHNKSTHSPIKRNILQYKINTKKLKPGLVASYNIPPGNGEGLFWFRHFINMSLTYLDTYPLTAPGLTQGKNWRTLSEQFYCLYAFADAN